MDWAPWVGGTLTAAGVVGAAVAYGLRDVARAYFARWSGDIEGKLRPGEAERTGRFAATFDRLRDLKTVDRVLLFTGWNAGGLPKRGKPYTARCYYGWSTAAGRHPESDYDFNMKLDDSYIAVLQELIIKGEVEVSPAKLPPDSMLRGFYDSEGVKYSMLYFIALDPKRKELLYCSVASYSGAFSPEDLLKVRHYVHKMRALYDYLPDPGTGLEHPAMRS